MTYDGFILAAVISELNSRIKGGKIQKIRQHNDTDLTFEVRAPGFSYMLFFSVDARFARVYSTSSLQAVLQTPPNFCMLLRKYAQGAYIEDIEQVGMDRIMKMRLGYPDGTRLTLIMEIMGKHSNLILVNSEGKILGAAKNIGSSVSRYRQVLPGREYTPPPGEEKYDIRNIDAQGFDTLWNSPIRIGSDQAAIKKWLMNTFSGFGPFLADEIVLRSLVDSEVSVDKLKDEVLQLGDMVERASYETVLITDESGHGTVVYPMPSVQFAIPQQHLRSSINEALDTLFRSLVTRTALDEERTQTLAAIRRAMSSRKQILKSIDRTVTEAENADKYKQTGELILGNLNAIEKGAKSVNLTNYYDPDMPEVTIELDEKLNAQQNAERYFKRYQKARDAVSTAQSRKEITLHAIERLESARNEAESAVSVDSLKNIRKALVEQDLLRSDAAQEKPSEVLGGEKIRRFMTAEGWEILYGENAKANDYLTQRVARPNDVWLHARSITGAHVVIRTAGHTGGLPRNVLIQAAKIAAQNSDAKHSSLVPIDHTTRKYVRKPRGSAPGFVIYRNEKTIDINPRA